VLHCFTASHHTTGFDTLEHLERTADQVTSALAERGEVAGSVVLATCNRFEVYLDVPAHVPAASVALAEIGRATGMSAQDVHGVGTLLAGSEVVEHVISVASGLESVVVGEGEIAGQVRRAVEHARERGTVSRDLERVFTQASRTARGVKNRTELSSAGRSVVRLALDLAESRITDWGEASVLLVGTGRYAGASLAALRDRGVRNVRVFSRSGRATGFAERHGVEAVREGDLVDALAGSDLVVACTVAPTVVVDAGMVEEARRRPGALPRRLFIDLGLPRNVDAAVARVPETELLDLETIGAHAPVPELNAADEAKALVEKAVAEYRAASAEDAVTPALVALRKHVFDVLDREIAWTKRRSGDNPETEAALRHLAGVLLHTPSVRARELAREGRAEEFARGVSALFDVEAEHRRCPVTAVRRETDAEAGSRADAAGGEGARGGAAAS